MIEVRNLTKRYGTNPAIDDLSFSIGSACVYGILGPNGAGKSTVMNIMAGCLAPSAGDVELGGYHIADHPIMAKRLIGYLPEVPPLNPELTVRETLRFVIAVRGLSGAALRAELARLLEIAQVADAADRLIANLSKGYRQRVGLAQALACDPPILILDEPTAGLDPAQIVETRALIASLRSAHTVVLSSHILTEISAVCDDVMILSKGRMRAVGTPEALALRLHGGHGLDMAIRGTEAQVRAAISLLNRSDAAFSPLPDGLTRLTLRARGDDDPREALFWALSAAKLPILEMHWQAASLEDVFMELTGEGTVKQS